MKNFDLDLVLRATIAMLVITSPFDPVKLLFFNQTVELQQLRRSTAAATLTLYVAVILAISAFLGKELLDLLGINLNAFGAVGGIVIGGMGFEMLYKGAASQTQGEEQRERGPEQGDGLFIPLAIPLIAGPGSIATAVTLSTQASGWAGVLAMAIAIAAVALATFLFYRYLGDLLARLQPATIAILARLGGLLLATLGFQMFLNGIKNFFA